MILLSGLWLVMAVLEATLYWTTSGARRGLRRMLLGVTTVAVFVIATLLLVHDWQLWTIAWVLGGYRLLNSARTIVGRLPALELRTRCLRAHGWIVTLQLISVALAWLWTRHIFRADNIAVLAGLQLLVSLILLRVTTHTWRHTRLSDHIPPRTTAELPALSVLIPARNETDDLEACLRSLIASDYPKLEIVVLDDCSANRRTPEIIKSFAHDGVRFIQGDIPDEVRWLAKNQAYERLRTEASGELLLFCGVDVLFAPHSLRRLVEVLESKQKDMVSVLPLHAPVARATASLLQPMRYYWELCLPRRLFKRPPVLSTCWLIRAARLEADGGFGAVSRSVVPEAHFARQAVVSDAYSFVRGNDELGIQSAKPAREQYATTVRMRYPQLHRRLELVAVAALFELLFLVGPFVGLVAAPFLSHSMAYVALWGVSAGCLAVTYCLVAVDTKLNSAFVGWLLLPFAVLLDVVLLHISFWKYEFSEVSWKGRNVCVPVMRVEPRLPVLPAEILSQVRQEG